MSLKASIDFIAKIGFSQEWKSLHYRAVNPPRHQLLRIDREGMIDDVISHDKWRHLCQKMLVDSNQRI